MRRWVWFMVLVLLVGLSGCGASSVDTAATAAPQATADTAATAAPQATAVGSGASGSLTVFAAVSLTNAFTEIAKQFEAKNPGTHITFNFGASQQLSQQITQGAPADVFASANKKQMDVVIQAGEVISGTQQVFARNRLVMIYPKDNPAGVATLKDLAKPGIKVVLAAKEVPVGGYSLEFLAKASKLPEYTESFSQTVLSNVVSYEESVNAVLNKVVLGEADAGIVYVSDITRESSDKLVWVDIPDALNTIASFPIAPIKGSPSEELAKSFIAYVLSAEGQAVLTRYRFIPLQAPPGL